MSNIVRRLLTGFVFIPIILGLLYVAPLWAFMGFALVAVAIASWEFFGLSHGDDNVGRVIGAVLTLGFFLAATLTRFGELHSSAFILVCASLAPVAMLLSLLRPARIPSAFLETGAYVLGPLYVGGLVATIPLMHATGSRVQGAGLVVFSLMIGWMGDTAGMMFGKGIGGPKLYPAVSPNKTWSGSMGSLMGSMLGVVLAKYLFRLDISWAGGLSVALVAGIAGQLGDLCESVLKRSAGVKDSGGLLPGHGGFLDRLDALSFAGATVYLALRTGWLTLG